MKAVIPAAGFGTRFLPATKAMPKEMLPVVDKPAIQYVVEEAVASGIREILIVTGRGKRAIEDHFDRSIELEHILRKRKKREALSLLKKISDMADIHYVRQKEQKGLGDALLCARNYVDEKPFAVMLGDDIIKSKKPCLSQLLSAYKKYPSSMVAVEEVPRKKVSQYGIVEGNPISESVFEVRKLLEKPYPSKTKSTLGISGRYILTPDIFGFIKKTKKRYGEIQLTDALSLMLEKRSIYALRFEGKRYDIGDKVGYIKAIMDLSLERKEMKNELSKYLLKR